MTIDQKLFEMLFEQAKASSRLRANYDMRTSLDDTSQRMLNALIPGSEIPIHKHEDTAESVFCLCGRLDEVLFEEVVDYTNEAINTESEISVEIARLEDSQYVAKIVTYREIERIHLCTAEGIYGCQVPKGVWHSVEVLEPSVIFEAKDGAYKG